MRVFWRRLIEEKREREELGQAGVSRTKCPCVDRDCGGYTMVGAAVAATMIAATVMSVVIATVVVVVIVMAIVMGSGGDGGGGGGNVGGAMVMVAVVHRSKYIGWR